MLASFLCAALVVCFFSSITAAQGLCNASPYASLSCLTRNHDAATICSSVPEKTVTHTVTTTTLSVATLSTTAHAASQVTVESTQTESWTKTITSGSAKTITTYQTKLSTEITTLTTYIPAPSASAFATASIPQNSTCNVGSVIVALEGMSNDTLVTACSCIGKPVPTITLTTTVNAPAVMSQTTDFAGTAPTTTVYHIVRHTVTITAAPTKVVTANTVSCTTSTKIESYAAPTFTQVFGPKAGCSDTAAGSTRTLDASIDNVHNATQECKDLCSQKSKCSFVYIERLLDNKAHYRCSFNDQSLDADKDLSCGAESGILGAAIGYDACDRGSAEL